jgi:ribonuclease HI
MNDIRKIRIFTDGSCTLKNKKNKNKNNHGGLGVFFESVPEIKDFSKLFIGSHVTNQSMELEACVYGIEKVIKYMKTKDQHKLWDLEICTDSMYVINCINKWASKWIKLDWKRKVGKQVKDISNLKIIKKLYRLSKMYNVSYTHVNSHRKEPSKTQKWEWDRWNGNNNADKLAGVAMKKCLNIK